MLDAEGVFLELLNPSCHLSLGLSKIKEPSESRVVSVDNKRPSIEVIVEVFDSLDDGKQLLLSCAILLLQFV